MPRILKKKPHILKKEPRGNCRIAKLANTPLFGIVNICYKEADNTLYVTVKQFTTSENFGVKVSKIDRRKLEEERLAQKRREMEREIRKSALWFCTREVVGSNLPMKFFFDVKTDSPAKTHSMSL
jgi:hypothetical protein